LRRPDRGQYLRSSIKLGVPIHLVHGNNLGDAMALHWMMAKPEGWLPITGRMPNLNLVGGASL
jgi:hypothetical protein